MILLHVLNADQFCWDRWDKPIGSNHIQLYSLFHSGSRDLCLDKQRGESEWEKAERGCEWRLLSNKSVGFWTRCLHITYRAAELLGPMGRRDALGHGSCDCFSRRFVQR